LLFIEPRVDWTTYSANGPDIQVLNFTKTPHSFLPVRTADGDVFSFHYYDPWMFVPLFTRNMHNKAVEWPIMFRRMHAEATSRELVPFLTEFGCDHNWETSTDLRPDIYNRSTVRACIDLLFQQVESQLLNETYWNYNLHNSVNSHDNWNNEDFSLLGPDHSTRNLDVVARPYPMRSSAQPKRVFFDLGSKNAAFILSGSVVDSPTVIFVPHSVQYAGKDFEVRATTPSTAVEWDEMNQLLYWHPDKTKPQNQIIISPCGGLNESVLPDDANALLAETSFRMVVGAGKKVPVSWFEGACTP
jgi:hypothetical protein